jgi:hypothetical protein
MLGDMREEKKLSHITPLSPTYDAWYFAYKKRMLLDNVTFHINPCLIIKKLSIIPHFAFSMRSHRLLGRLLAWLQHLLVIKAIAKNQSKEKETIKTPNTNVLW